MTQKKRATVAKGLYPAPIFRIAGDRGLLMEFGDAVDPDINHRIRAMAMAIDGKPPRGIVEVIPTYCAIIVVYDPCHTDPATLTPILSAMDKALETMEIPEPETTVLPVCYHPALGPDLEDLAKRHNLTVDEVIRIHTEPLYPIYMIGFTPGFPYLGGLSEKLYTPRLDSPRKKVPAGSVGIANNQTGIYPIESPGGWQLIGRCPIKLFNPQKKNPILLKAGNLLKFKAIDLDEYETIKKREADDADLQNH
ncbi:putative allophanate hydrolase subunit 1 [Desulforapulum autotrophicum HRM2]|uniref:Allophanate hydrolase subunit 1 n=1 Tax=Desulforapulum autotrophicum (strain ATCC 43914 / DSM 3382 / VKM B-1955 / HRM2) TaxID=177437 RepID=C0QGD1_DESAH|nr:5-oxoprolinase subunit PxpB [Desulforapulum autotrophicum]ACN17710.1 putative allophanate hydrolase subunit 1 [Desulforapulum autotrophicum HRM2]